MSRLTKDYHEFLFELLQDPEEAAAYLTAALDEGDSATFALALRNVAAAKGLSTRTSAVSLPEDTLTPQLESLSALLSAMDLRLAVTTK